jgi:esterase/lipase
MYAHGIADTKAQADIYADAHIIGTPYFSFNFSDATERFFRVKFWNTSLGQSHEKELVVDYYNQLKKLCSADQIVVYALSRGTAAVINARLDARAFILESPYDSIETIAQSIAHVMFPRLNPQRATMMVHRAIAKIFRKYDMHGEQPIHNIHTINPATPILIVASKEDTLVPWQSSEKLYKTLKKSGHNHAYFLLLDHGKHGKIIFGPDREKYTQVVHAFRQKYGLPHNEKLAAFGMKTLQTHCQP